MAKLKIYQFPDTVLAQKARPIARVEKALRRFADDMLETMYAAPGIGLAANQVGVLDRVLVVDVDYELDESDGDEAGGGPGEAGTAKISHQKPIVVINPEIIYKEGKITFCEGCLSVPEYTAEVQRAEKIKVQYQDIDGAQKVLSAEGLLAIALQHEMDHLDGKLFVDRLSPIKKEMVKKKLKRERLERENSTLDEIVKSSRKKKSKII